MVMRKCPALSPIPESPYSNTSTPRSLEIQPQAPGSTLQMPYSQGNHDDTLQLPYSQGNHDDTLQVPYSQGNHDDTLQLPYSQGNHDDTLQLPYSQGNHDDTLQLPYSQGNHDDTLQVPYSQDNHDDTLQLPYSQGNHDDTLQVPYSQGNHDDTLQVPYSQGNHDDTLQVPYSQGNHDDTLQVPYSQGNHDDTLQVPYSQGNHDDAKAMENSLLVEYAEGLVTNAVHDSHRFIVESSTINVDDAQTRENSAGSDGDTEQDRGDNDGDGVYDEVDGGMISRLFGMCIPRLNTNASNDDSDEELVEETTRKECHDDGSTMDEDGSSTSDGGRSSKNEDEPVTNQEVRSPYSEVNEDVEDMLQQILQNTNDIALSPDNDETNSLCTEVKDEQVNKTQQMESTSDVSAEMESTSDVSADISHHENKKKNLKQKWTLDYISQMRRLSHGELDEVFVQHEGNKNTHKFNNSLSNNVCLDDALSDNDSSYISCESNSRHVSDCSTFESSDSVLSSQDSTRGMTPDEDTPCGSVDITVHERIYKQSTTSSNSSDSRSTLSNNSVVSAPSFVPSNRRVLRSQVSSGSLSSATSCGAEIQWQKGSILGKGGFGTWWVVVMMMVVVVMMMMTVVGGGNDDGDRSDDDDGWVVVIVPKMMAMMMVVGGGNDDRSDDDDGSANY
ncbi:hypothetical protein QZH41_014724 [Actinostola sp. cb2023]|nr:hypothetical protein QZH41_014724 [Actinostola sp. cb2023]